MPCDWGECLRVDVFGESHAEAVGVTLEGLPANEAVDLDELARFLRRRAPGRGALVSARREPDLPQITDGLRDGKTTGGPLTVRASPITVQRSPSIPQRTAILSPQRASLRYSTLTSRKPRCRALTPAHCSARSK